MRGFDSFLETPGVRPPILMKNSCIQAVVRIVDIMWGLDRAKERNAVSTKLFDKWHHNLTTLWELQLCNVLMA